MTEPGGFHWNELMTNDLEKARKFYGSVIGWQTKDMPMGPGVNYTLWVMGDRQNGGAMKMDGPQFKGVPPHWLAYVSVPDVDAAAGRAAKGGGKVVMAPFDVPNVGRIALIQDPSGATLGIITPAPRPAS